MSKTFRYLLSTTSICKHSDGFGQSQPTVARHAAPHNTLIYHTHYLHIIMHTHTYEISIINTQNQPGLKNLACEKGSDNDV